MPLPIDPDQARILEIGAHAVFKQAFPERTTLLYGYTRIGEPQSFYTPFTLRSGWKALREIRAGKFDLIVVWADPYPPWNHRRLKAVFSRPLAPLASLVRIFAVELLRLVKTDIPIVVIDNEDPRMIARHNLHLIDKARYYFKRELPVDRWQALQHTAYPGMPGPRFRMLRRQRRRLEKLRPISIGVTPRTPLTKEFSFPEKTSDVFAALQLSGVTTVRSEGIRQLKALGDQGIKLDIPQQRLSQEEFYRRMSQAWLTWSPEGLGWDCFRHYEAPLLGTVPVINYPTIARYRPLVDGVHAFYYAPDEPESLGAKIKEALFDKERLRAMALAGRAHVLAHHVRPRPFADAVVRMGLGLEEAPGGVVLD